MVHYRTLVPPFAALVAVVLFARLGIWQLHRADEAKALATAIAAHAEARPVMLEAAAVDGNPAAFHWRAVEARGTWAKARQILLDNQISHGVAGYYVYTPFRLRDCDCAVLVNRGWIAAGPLRSDVPDIAFAAARAAVRGVAAPAPAAGFGIKAAAGEPVGAATLRVQRLDAAELSQWLGMRILPLTVLLAPDEPGGYRREWHPPDAHADRHVAYAVQWFLFALIAAGIAIRLNSARR